MERLPLELSLRIVRLLPTNDLLSLSCSSRRLRCLCFHPDLWPDCHLKTGHHPSLPLLSPDDEEECVFRAIVNTLHASISSISWECSSNWEIMRAVLAQQRDSSITSLQLTQGDPYSECLTDQSIKDIAHLCPQIESLAIAGDHSRLTGACFAHLAALPRLRFLSWDVRHARSISGESLAWFISNCSRLEELSLKSDRCDRVNNHFVSKLLSRHGDSLVKLRLVCDDELTSDSLSSLTFCHRLHKLTLLTGCSVDRTCIRYFGQLPALEELELRCEEWVDANYDILAGLPNMGSIMSLSLVHAVQLSDASADLLSRNLPLLSRIKLTDAFSLTDSGVCSLLVNCKSLESLVLRECTALVGSFVTHAGITCHSLQRLDLRNCDHLIGDLLLSVPSFSPNVRFLSLSDCLSDVALALNTLAKCVRLSAVTAINIYNELIQLSFIDTCEDSTGCTLSLKAEISSLSEADLEQLLTSMPRLKTINVFCASLPGSWLLRMLEACPDVESLSVQQPLTGFFDHPVGAVLPQLKYLNLLAMSICDSQLRHIMAACPNLEHISGLSAYCHIQDETISLLLERCPRIRHFSMGVQFQPLHLRGIITSGSCFNQLSTSLPSLRVLHICSFFNLHDGGLSSIAQHCPKLLELNVRDCRSITDDGLAVVVRSLRLLRLLHISSTPVNGAFLMSVPDTSCLPRYLRILMGAAIERKFMDGCMERLEPRVQFCGYQTSATATIGNTHEPKYRFSVRYY